MIQGDYNKDDFIYIAILLNMSVLIPIIPVKKLISIIPRKAYVYFTYIQNDVVQLLPY